jgi:RNA polymerase sigma-70 factor (ECF subfamily)
VTRDGGTTSGDAAGASAERALVDRLRRGDATAFDRVYATYHPRVFSFLLRLSGRRDTAEDLAQETWLKLAKAAPGLREDTTLAPFLFTIARNAFMSHRRWAMLDLSRIVTFGLESMSSAASEPTPEAHHERARAIALLEDALQRLPLASREVLLLIGVEGMDQEEVAKMLGLSYDALRQRLSRARAQLAETMASFEKKQSAIAARRSPKRGETT